MDDEQRRRPAGGAGDGLPVQALHPGSTTGVGDGAPREPGPRVTRAVAFDGAGRQLAVTAMPNAYEEPGQGAVEQDMDRTWQDVVTVLGRLHEAVPDLQSRAALLAVTGQGDGTWLVDRDGRSVAPGWVRSGRSSSGAVLWWVAA